MRRRISRTSRTSRSIASRLRRCRPSLAAAGSSSIRPTPTTTRGWRATANAAPVPIVLVVHGGPWGRDGWGLSSTHQWLANRGYAVLSVNFRGSTGFGKTFLNAANREWGGRMHDDLIDAVDWAIARGVADPKRVAIYGASYGGYSALVGATFTPEKFAC